MGSQSLSAILPGSDPWLDLEAHSDQYLPLPLGASPRDQALFGKKESRAYVPAYLRELGEAQIRMLQTRLGLTKAEFEGWPVLNDYGQLTWAFARWRPEAGAPWVWLDRADFVKPPEEPGNEEDSSLLEKFKLVRFPLAVAPVFLPRHYPFKEGEENKFNDVFASYDSFPDLYKKPTFANCIWLQKQSGEVLAGWLPSKARASQEKWYRGRREKSELTCLSLPQPPRLQSVPFTLIVKARGKSVQWPSDVAWDFSFLKKPKAVAIGELKIKKWPSDFSEKYVKDLKALSGEDPAEVKGKEILFQRKNSGDPKNQLPEMVKFLAARYQALGIKDLRVQSFTWNGIPQQNLIAVIPGMAPDHEKRPILLADHYDTAYAQKVFDETGERVSVPGADDNLTATVALLRAAEVLPSLKLKRDVYLVHLTGEEFPSDCLGARHLVSRSLLEGKDIGGVVLMDMIGYNRYKRDDRPGPARPGKIFQINPGFSQESRAMGALAVAVARKMNGQPTLEAAYRDPYGLENYLYNTDGVIFSWAGYPVVLFNEHMNRFNLNRPDYHEMSDRVDLLDINYLSFVAKTAIETAAQLAGQ